MRSLILVLTLLAAQPALAQKDGNSSFSVNVDGFYSAISYSEPAAPASQTGHFAGVRGDLGVSLMQGLGISLGGDYADGNMTFTGKTLKGTSLTGLTSSDYMRTLYGLVSLDVGLFTLTAGTAESEWYDNLPGSYRRREIFKYYPLGIVVSRGVFYLKAEYDIWNGGTNKAYMSDSNASAIDVTCKQSAGSGYGAEVGVLIPTAMFYQNRIFAAYHHWDIGDSNTVNDGVQNITAGKNTTNVIEGGIGVSF